MQDEFVPPFIERKSQLHEIRNLLLEKHSRIVVIQGEPGSGKTAFARVFSHTMDAETFWLTLQQVTRRVTGPASGYLAPLRYSLAFDEGAIRACRRARYVFVDGVDRFSLNDVLGLIEKCPQQQFVLLSSETLDLPVSTIDLSPLACYCRCSLVG